MANRDHRLRCGPNRNPQNCILKRRIGPNCSTAVARFALKEGYFGGPDFDYSRMSWIKPNFTWMMYRSAWGRKESQECTLGIRVSRRFFDSILVAAVPSSFVGSRCSSQEEWQRALVASDVRLQWDPDHDPSGAKLTRRAIQLGLRGKTLRNYGRDEIIEIVDLSPFVAEQQHWCMNDTCELRTPSERVYLPRDPRARENVQLDTT